MDVSFIETHDGGAAGAKGVGEAPVICIAAAIANAIYNATGVRFIELPFTPEKVLTKLREAREVWGLTIGGFRTQAQQRPADRNAKRIRPISNG